jgi:hypothetical protein
MLCYIFKNLRAWTKLVCKFVSHVKWSATTHIAVLIYVYFWEWKKKGTYSFSEATSEPELKYTEEI